ncbi:MAG: sn-glycerol-1-phosphate dehydrogenase [Chloroflexota bacterium]|nr:sn-glycerol-1-phosphate dehydrogenase [Chloroflexota bacterium]
MDNQRPEIVTIDNQAISHLIDYCRRHGVAKLALIADHNTYGVLGQAVEAGLKAQGLDVASIVFDTPEVVADARHILQIMVTVDRAPRTYVAVGSGTLTDITRFASWRTGNPFVAMPTAPSVDGFASLGAPLIVEGVKTTYITQAPRAIFANLDTLVTAPRAMIAAGFGDIMGKFTAAADWRLGHLLWDEPFDEAIAQRTAAVAQRCTEQAQAVGEGSPDGVHALMEGLIDSGFTMLDLGSSRNASGSEHHYSHYWEMKLLEEGRPAILHGAKVGVATVLLAQLYDCIKALNRQDVSDRLEASTLPTRDSEIARIQAAFGDMAPAIIAAQRPFLDLTEAAYSALKQRIGDNWDEVLAIAAQVPPGQEITRSLQIVGGPTTVAELGLTAQEQVAAEQYGHYLRQRFTVRKLARVLGLG